MTLSQLQYFATLARHLNFSRAAQTLYITQPTLSYQISELERELGTALFVRDKRRVYLTPAGAAILENVELVMGLVETIRRQAQQQNNAMPKEGEIRIVMDDAESYYEHMRVARGLAEFVRECPEIETAMEMRVFEDCIESIKSGSADLAVLILRSNDTQDQDMNMFEIEKDFLSLMYPKSFGQLGLEELLQKYPILYIEDKPRGRLQLSRALNSAGLAFDTRMFPNTISAMARAEAGEGVVVVPARVHEAYYSDKFLRTELKFTDAEIGCCAVWSVSNINPAIQRFINQFNN